MSDAVDELIESCQQHGVSPTQKRVHQFHRTNPQLLDFLILELRDVRASGWLRTSLGSLWHHARWVLTQADRAPGESFVMPNNLFPYYERIIVILFPEFNGFFEMAKSKADDDLGTTMESERRPGEVRKLVWADGTAIENGWRPSVPHEPKPVGRRPRVTRKPPTSIHASKRRVRK